MRCHATACLPTTNLAIVLALVCLSAWPVRAQSVQYRAEYREVDRSPFWSSLSYAAIDNATNRLFVVSDYPYRLTVYDLSTDTYDTWPIGGPSLSTNLVFDPDGRRLLQWRSDQYGFWTIDVDVMPPVTEYMATPNRLFSAHGGAAYWNSVSGRLEVFGGYGYSAMHNWLWTFDEPSWSEIMPNRPGTEPWPQNGYATTNPDGTVMFFEGIIGTPSGAQTRCPDPDAIIVHGDLWCWMRNLWRLDLTDYSWTNLVPRNSESILAYGPLVYHAGIDAPVIVGLYHPPTTRPPQPIDWQLRNEVMVYNESAPGVMQAATVTGRVEWDPNSEISAAAVYDASGDRILVMNRAGLWELKVGPADSDGDGILDEVDYCPASIVDTMDPGPNRYVWTGPGLDFNSGSPPGNGQGTKDTYSLLDTQGCTCSDIVELTGLSGSASTKGCSDNHLDAFIASLGATGKRGAEMSDPADLPTEVALDGNYPNPFNPSTTIAFSLPVETTVRLTVFDAMGRAVAYLMDGRLGAGRHEIRFDASGLPSGVYLYRLDTPERTATGTMLLAK